MHSVEEERPLKYVERESPYLTAELRRVLSISVVTFGLLIALVVVDRLQ